MNVLEQSDSFNIVILADHEYKNTDWKAQSDLVEFEGLKGILIDESFSKICIVD